MRMYDKEQAKINDRDILNSWIKKIGQMEVAFDIGANTGNYSIYLAKHTDIKKIYAFEPYEMNYDVLTENIKNNGLEDKIEAYKGDIGDKSGKALVKSIDEFIDQNDIKRVDFVKINTEDFEEHVLSKMIDSIEKYIPTICVEVKASNFEFVNNLLLKYGYILTDISGFNILYMNIKRFPNAANPKSNTMVKNLLINAENVAKYAQRELVNIQNKLLINQNDLVEKQNEMFDSFNSTINKKDEQINSLYQNTCASLNETIKSKTETIELLKKNNELINAQLQTKTKETVGLKQNCLKLAENAANSDTKLRKEQKRADELNTLLYQANRKNEAYERLSEVKLYNRLRQFKHRNEPDFVVSKNTNPPKPLQDEKVSKEIKAVATQTPKEQQSAVAPKPANTNAAQKKPAPKNTVKLSSFKGIKQMDKEDVKHFVLKHKVNSLKELKVACIMDEFTYECFEPECNLFKVSPENWQSEIEAFEPDMLFVESAWQGNDGRWARMVDRTEKPFVELTQFCHKQEIPVVFWNKEDPAWNKEFMAAAGLCDFVFTTELDCVLSYKKNLGHDRVYLMHFAAQPKVHNPIETFERRDAFAFAGAYYHKYPKRSEAFDNIAHYAMRERGLDIFDRNYKNARPEHAFPKYYDPFILGRLEPSEIDVAYKGYAYNINMNSVTQSQTMFARRVFELMASNCVVVGNFSRGQKNLFGDLTIATDDIDTLKKTMRTYCDSEEMMHNYRLQSFRRVTNEHLYEDRFNYIIEKVFDVTLEAEAPLITVIGVANTKENLKAIKKAFERQNYDNKKLCVKVMFKDKLDKKDIEIIPKNMDLSEFIDKNVQSGYVAYFHKNDWYGENYLYDLALMLRYDFYDAVGKSKFYELNHDNIKLVGSEGVYTKVDELNVRRSIIHYEHARKIDFDNKIIKAIDDDGNLIKIVSADEFNYCANNHGEHCEEASDIKVTDTGVLYADLQKIGEKIEIHESAQTIIPFTSIFDKKEYDVEGKVKISQEGAGFNIKSTLDSSTHRYVYANKMIEVDEQLKENFYLLLEGEPTMDIILALICLDENHDRIGDIYAAVGLSKKISLPKETKYIKAAIRIKGAGTSKIKCIKIDDTPIGQSNCFISRSGTLVLTNVYPSYENLYRNMFVHSRVLNYKKLGKNMDVMRFQYNTPDGYREFEGINVTEGFTEKLENILMYGNIDTVCVHFLDQDMWNVLKKFKEKIRIIVWCHGSEIQPWWRRKFNYDSEEKLNEAKRLSQARMELWSNIFEESKDSRIQFVFVSDFFKNEVAEDYNVKMSNDKFVVIHNLIDTDKFEYFEKSSELRKKLLSIRPFNTKNYANDLTALCIEELSKKDYFEELEFRIVGRGVLFDSVTEPLKKFSNVILENKFLTRDEIAELHKDYGIFLNPTRLDSQGVSRDEAMSSGLVPVTNAVTAIPEFVDESCGILAPGEDYKAMAEGIDRLIRNPELFLEMSKNAAERVRNQSSEEFTIKKELELINDKN